MRGKRRSQMTSDNSLEGGRRRVNPTAGLQPCTEKVALKPSVAAGYQSRGKETAALYPLG